MYFDELDSFTLPSLSLEPELILNAEMIYSPVRILIPEHHQEVVGRQHLL